jgi:hypothetical protein
MQAANALQDVARVAARELAVTPFPADITFDDLPGQPGTGAASWVDPTTGEQVMKLRIYDSSCLVINLDDPAVEPDPQRYFAALPVANRSLLPLMITEPARPNILRYPGALLNDSTGAQCSAIGPNGMAGPTGYTVGIPLVASRDVNGVETITWVPVVEEVRTDPNDPTTGPFSLTDLSGVAPDAPRGLVALRVNYPYQAGGLTGFRASLPTPTDPLPPNLSNPIVADDGAVSAPPPLSGTLAPDDPDEVGAYAGRYGLGRQLAFAGLTVRPFRRLVTAQAIFRREVFQ